jgi:hypothetical protein
VLLWCARAGVDVLGRDGWPQCTRAAPTRLAPRLLPASDPGVCECVCFFHAACVVCALVCMLCVRAVCVCVCVACFGAAPWTPFAADGSVNVAVIPTLAQSAASDGCNVVWIGGGMGEFDTLSTTERNTLASAWVAAAKPLGLYTIVHVGTTVQADAIAMAAHAAAIGAGRARVHLTAACLPASLPPSLPPCKRKPVAKLVPPSPSTLHVRCVRVMG